MSVVRFLIQVPNYPQSSQQQQQQLPLPARDQWFAPVDTLLLFVAAPAAALPLRASARLPSALRTSSPNAVSSSHLQPLSAFLPPTLEGQFFPSSCLHFFFLSGLISLLFLFFVFFFVPLIPLFFSCWISLLSCKSLPELFTLCFVLLLEGKPVLYPFLSLFSVSFFFVTFCSLFFLKKMKSAVFLISYRIYLDFHEFGSSVCPPHRNHTTSFFFNSCKVQNGFLCILYLNAAGAAWQMWGCWCC